LSIQAIVNTNGELPEDVPPFEKHPYLETLDPQSTATGLMIGTFPPITYLCNLLNIDELSFNGISSRGLKRPILNYFHGNKGTFWRFTPINFDQIQHAHINEQPQLIKNALCEHGILYTDIIKYTQRKLTSKDSIDEKYDADDKKLTSIIINKDIFSFLFKSNLINRLYFTNACFFVTSNPLFHTDNQLKLKENDAFSLFIKAALDEGIILEYKLWDSEIWVEINENMKSPQHRKMINNQLKTKVVLRLKLTKNGVSKIYEVCSSASPASINRNAHLNPCCLIYGDLNNLQGVQRATELLRTVLLNFFNNNLNELAQYNS
jgi:hypothetical protein